MVWRFGAVMGFPWQRRLSRCVSFQRRELGLQDGGKVLRSAAEGYQPAAVIHAAVCLRCFENVNS